VNGRTTYGDLTRDTTHAMAVAHSRLVATTFPSHAAALRAIEAYRDMASALASLGGRLIHGPQRLATLAGTSGVPDPLRPAAHLCDVLASVGRARPWQDTRAQSTEPVVQALTRAAVLARTAHDLLATYSDTSGAHTSPRSERLEQLGERLAGMERLADQAGLLADAADTLALKAIQAGVDAEHAILLHEGGRALRRAVDELRLEPQDPGRWEDRLADLAVARPAVRTDDPLTELSDRVTRLHRFAWQLTTEPRVGVATLTNYAAAGALIAKAAGRELQRTTGLPDLPHASGWATHQLQQLHEAAAGWYAIYRQLGRLRSLTPGVAGVHRDVYRIRHLLNDGALSRAPERAVLGALLGASRAFDDIARWNVHTLAHVVAPHLWVAGQELPRDLVTDIPELARSRLAGRFVAAPPSTVRDIAVVYGQVQCSLGDSTKRARGRWQTPPPFANDPLAG
jgi:hypothetical protein